MTTTWGCLSSSRRRPKLTEWDYRGLLFTYPKHKLRNLEVPELLPLGNKWILLASAGAPVDRVVYFIGDFDQQTLKFTPQRVGHHTVSRRLREENVKGDRISLTRLGGRAILKSLEAWPLRDIN